MAHNRHNNGFYLKGTLASKSTSKNGKAIMATLRVWLSGGHGDGTKNQFQWFGIVFFEAQMHLIEDYPENSQLEITGVIAKGVGKFQNSLTLKGQSVAKWRPGSHNETLNDAMEVVKNYDVEVRGENTGSDTNKTS